MLAAEHAVLRPEAPEVIEQLRVTSRKSPGVAGHPRWFELEPAPNVTLGLSKKRSFRRSGPEQCVQSRFQDLRALLQIVRKRLPQAFQAFQVEAESCS